MWLEIYFGCDKIIKPYRPIDMPQAEYDKRIELIYNQVKESKVWGYQGLNVPDILITCGGCKKKHKIQVMYRCYYCKVYYCQVCAAVHFKENS